MEHMPLGDLQQSVADAESILELDIANVTWQILDGLHFMHDNDFAHRDMKPRVMSPDQHSQYSLLTNIEYSRCFADTFFMASQDCRLWHK